jgi:hypothetical protein
MPFGVCNISAPLFIALRAILVLYIAAVEMLKRLFIKRSKPNQRTSLFSFFVQATRLSSNSPIFFLVFSSVSLP